MARRVTSFWHDFREFIAKGNVVDLAVAVIIGGAFGKVVTSLVEDIVMPALINPVLSQAGTSWREAEIGPGIRIGSFIGTVVDFLLIALVIYLVIRAFERFKRKEAVAAVEPEAPDSVAVQQRLADVTDRLAAAIETRRL